MLRDFQFHYSIVDFPVWHTRHLGGLGGMENTPTGHGSDLPTILGERLQHSGIRILRHQEREGMEVGLELSTS